MKITIESTQKMVTLDGVPARIWQGQTENGIPVHCYVTRIAVAADADCSQFERELEEHAEPRPEVNALDNRFVL